MVRVLLKSAPDRQRHFILKKIARQTAVVRDRYTSRFTVTEPPKRSLFHGWGDNFTVDCHWLYKGKIMPTKLSRWGNSLGLRVSSHIVETAGLKVGDLMYIRILDSGDILVRAVKPRDVHAGYAVDDGEPREPARELTKEEVRLKW